MALAVRTRKYQFDKEVDDVGRLVVIQAIDDGQMFGIAGEPAMNDTSLTIKIGSSVTDDHVDDIDDFITEVVKTVRRKIVVIKWV
jgi:hypothetical protein